MKYAVNEQGVAAMNNMANAITTAIDEIDGATKTTQEIADEYNDVLGPHKSELDSALEDIAANIKNSTSPAADVAERLRDVADGYQDVIDSKLI